MKSENEIALDQLPREVDPELLKELALGRPWFQSMDLGCGVVSPGVDRSKEKLEYLAMPDSFEGQSVLDIGAYDGFFSFEAERRGAARVVASDDLCWSLQGMGDGRGFDIAHWALQSKVEKRRIKVEDISPETVGMFDVVLFLGVLYHSRDPLGYLSRVFSVCNRMAIVETEVDLRTDDRPIMVFCPGAVLYGDPSNFWVPNQECAEEMLLDVGFQSVQMVGQSGARMAFHAFR
jgi:tRNA (mo5U34)-methyltransferase